MIKQTYQRVREVKNLLTFAAIKDESGFIPKPHLNLKPIPGTPVLYGTFGKAKA